MGTRHKEMNMAQLLKTTSKMQAANRLSSQEKTLQHIRRSQTNKASELARLVHERQTSKPWNTKRLSGAGATPELCIVVGGANVDVLGVRQLPLAGYTVAQKRRPVHALLDRIKENQAAMLEVVKRI
jgi:hypothetical protein